LIWLAMSRVPSRSAFGSDHNVAAAGAGAVVDVDVDVVDAVVEVDVEVCVELLEDLWLLPPHAATTTATTNNATAETARRDGAVLMGFMPLCLVL
jgi:hypothetical protein